MPDCTNAKFISSHEMLGQCIGTDASWVCSRLTYNNGFEKKSVRWFVIGFQRVFSAIENFLVPA